MRAAYISKVGGPSVIQFSKSYEKPTVSPQKPFLIKMKYASVNYIDTYFRSGLYNMSLPAILGGDGAGYIDEIHESFLDNTYNFKKGDAVAIKATATYAEFVTVGLEQLVKVPEGIPLDVATAFMINGLTAHYLTRSTFPLTKNHTCLVQAVAGGTGQLIAQIAKNVCGATVVGTCSSGKVNFVNSELDGVVDHLINYEATPDFHKEVRKFTDNVGVDVVYDGVGKTTFEKSLDSLKKRGMMVSFGNASGAVPPFSALELGNRGSLYFTRPSLMDYINNPGELSQRATDLFDWYSKSLIDINIQSHYKLEDVSKAHADLESRKSQGKFIIDI